MTTKELFEKAKELAKKCNTPILVARQQPPKGAHRDLPKDHGVILIDHLPLLGAPGEHHE